MDDKVGSLNLECRLPMSTPSVFKWRQFLPEMILLNVRWYCRYGLSYRDLEQMMVERGIEVDHATSNRWVLKYAAELDKRSGLIYDLRATRGECMKRTSTSKNSGSTCTERSMPLATPWTFC